MVIAQNNRRSTIELKGNIFRVSVALLPSCRRSTIELKVPPATVKLPVNVDEDLL